MGAEMTAPTVKRIRAYFAPVNRVAQQATLFDPAQSGAFPLETPPAPWVDLGWIYDFARTSQSITTPVKAGTPASTQIQVRTDIEAQISFTFESWGKLQLSLASGTQQMNLLATAGPVNAVGSGGAAIAATPLGSGSSATVLQFTAANAAAFQVGDFVAVDIDYTAGTTGFVGNGVSGAYVRTALTDVDYVRRVTLNVGQVQSISGSALTLQEPLLAGTPSPAMKVSAVLGFCDREGSSFFQEWSALFVAEGQQGERILWHYPRLQASAGISELQEKSSGGYRAVRLKGSFRALPVVDAVDGEHVLCFRSYLPS